MPLIKFFKKLLRAPNSASATQAAEEFCVPRNKHHVSKTEINPYALQIINQLNHHGYQAYLVGGSVRDLLLRKVPKDFDVSTSATPAQIRKLFRNARIIGRRFKLVHITFNREIIEVSTFRSNTPDEQMQTNDKGMVIRDNTFGSLEQDAWRRDFTINSLYYDVQNGSIVDYTGGFEDIKLNRIRMIGDPKLRYQEDPVRMLRAIRFAAKLHFEIHEATAAPIFELAHLISHVSNARLFDETVKLWQCQEASKVYQLLNTYGIFKLLFPASAALMEAYPEQEKLISIALENTDRRLKEQKPSTPAFIFAVLLWFPLQELSKQLQETEELHPLNALEKAMNTVLIEQCRIIAIPKRFTQIMREIWLLQFRFNKRVGQKPQQLMSHARFRASYDFLALRALAGDESIELADWWAQFQDADESGQINMIELLSNKSSAPRKRRKKSKPQSKNDE